MICEKISIRVQTQFHYNDSLTLHQTHYGKVVRIPVKDILLTLYKHESRSVSKVAQGVMETTRENHFAKN